MTNQFQRFKPLYFNYKIVEVKSLDELAEFANHERLKVFHQKGTKCIHCNRQATVIAKGKGRGSFHWDLYCKEPNGKYIPLTVDHILPKGLGGTNDINNLQPLCYPCNRKKGSKYEGYFVKINELESIALGTNLYRVTESKIRFVGQLVAFYKKQNITYLYYKTINKGIEKIYRGDSASVLNDNVSMLDQLKNCHSYYHFDGKRHKIETVNQE